MDVGILPGGAARGVRRWRRGAPPASVPVRGRIGPVRARERWGWAGAMPGAAGGRGGSERAAGDPACREPQIRSHMHALHTSGTHLWPIVKPIDRPGPPGRSKLTRSSQKMRTRLGLLGGVLVLALGAGIAALAYQAGREPGCRHGRRRADPSSSSAAGRAASGSSGSCFGLFVLFLARPARHRHDLRRVRTGPRTVGRRRPPSRRGLVRRPFRRPRDGRSTRPVGRPRGVRRGDASPPPRARRGRADRRRPPRRRPARRRPTALPPRRAPRQPEQFHARRAGRMLRPGRPFPGRPLSPARTAAPTRRSR